MIPFPYSPWPFLDFGQDPNDPPPVPDVPGVTIPWSMLPPVAPPPPAPPPVVPPPNSPPPQTTVPPSDTPGFDKTFAPQPSPPPVAQAPRNPSLADIIAPWIQPPEPEPPPPALPPSETPGLDKAIARINAPTPGFHLTPGLGGFTQPPMWSLPPPPQLLSIPPLPMPSLGGGLGALASHLPPMAPAPSPLILANSGSAAPTMPQPGVGPGIPETLTQMARRLAPFATRFGNAASLIGQILLEPWQQQDATVDLGNGLRLRERLDPGSAILEQLRPRASGDGWEWQRMPIDARTTLGNGSRLQLQIDPDQLRSVLGDETASRLLNMPGIMPMAKPTDEQPQGADDASDPDSDQEAPDDSTSPPPALPKPEGIPDDWIAKPSKKNGGVRYFNPKNKHDQVRVMPGNPKSPNPRQQRPYVIDQKNGSIVDKNGRPIGGAKPDMSPDAHIPLEDFKFRR